MLDLKLIRDNPEVVKAGILKKHRDPGMVDRVLEIDRRRREVVQEVERLRAEQNRASGEIPKLKGEGREQRIAAMREISTSLKSLEPQLREVEAALQRALLELPNLPHESVPPGEDASENVPLRHWGEKPRLDFKPLDHVDIGTRLGILDMERGAKVSGSRFYYLRVAGISWCFRREAGSYGKDVRGIYRVHQFDKLEMFSFTVPDASWKEHEYLVSLHERLLQQLGLHHRVVAVCGGDTSAPSAKTYDVETWMPARGEYGETSSISNCTDFQARRLGIRVRRAKGTAYAHTLNGTAVATSRALVAILENCQQKDGTIRVPDALVPYMNGMKVITPAL